jgi:hypothetical protein
MIDKTDLQKVELANDILLVLESASTQDQIDILQLALDSMLAKKQLNNSDALAQMKKEELVTNIWYVRSESEVELVYRVERTRTGFFSCTCPDFQIRHRECKHIKKVKMKLAGEKQKNKLPGAET